MADGRMRAAVRTGYGRPRDVVRVVDVDRPEPVGDQIRVQVHAASVNRADLDGIEPRPGFLRLFLGLRRPRDPRIGPQGLPVNTSAWAAGVADVVGDPGYELLLSGPSGTVTLSLAQLNAMAQSTVDLPISCVEGWSADAQWSGIPLRDLVALVGGGDADVEVVSLQRQGGYKSTVDRNHAVDPLTLLALRLNGATLHPDHGYPARIIAPNQPGVLQTKWVSELRVKAVTP